MAGLRVAAGARCLFGLGLWLLVAACGDSGSTSQQTACTPGRSVECSGPAQCAGYQECSSDGSGYGACVCDGATGGTTGVGGGAGTGAGPSAQAGTSSTGGTGPGSCEPVALADWTPPPYVPARAATEACTSTEVTDYFDADCQFGGCADFMPGGLHEACGACLEPHEADATAYGPILKVSVGSTSSRETNAAGCIELAGQADCAAANQALEVCMREACLADCAPSTTEEYTLYSACKAAARTGVCATYAEAAACLTPATGTACNGPDVWVTIATAFCGAP